MSALTTYLDGLDNKAGGWNLDSTSGDEVDTSGNGNGGVVTIGAGSRGAAAIEGGGTLSMDFDALATKVVVTSNAAFADIWDAGGSVFFLMHPDGGGENNVGHIYSRSSAAAYLFLDDPSGGTSRLRLTIPFFGPGSWRTTSRVITHGTSYAVIITYNADATTNDPTFYIREIGSGSTTTYTVGSGLTEVATPFLTRVSDATENLTIGNGAGDTWTFDGTLSCLRLYSDVLSGTEITDIMEAADGAPVDATIISVTATATAAANVPGVTLAEDSVAATATASAGTPTIQTPTLLQIPSEVATATAGANIPGTSLTMASVTAEATTTAQVPTVTLSLSPPTAAATAAANVPDIDAIGPGEDFSIPASYADPIYVGSQKACYAQFKDADGAFFNPDTVTFKTRTPGGTDTSYVFGVASEIDHDAVGVFHLTFTVTSAGPWIVAAQGTDGDAVGQLSFEAEKSILT